VIIDLEELSARAVVRRGDRTLIGLGLENRCPLRGQKQTCRTVGSISMIGHYRWSLPCPENAGVRSGFLIGPFLFL
jgi:hypothetical protein